MRVFLIEQFPRHAARRGHGPLQPDGPVGVDFLPSRLPRSTTAEPSPALSSPPLYALLYPLWQLGLLGATLLAISAENEEPRRASLEWAAFTCLLLAAVYRAASYHRVVLILVAILGVCAIKSFWHRAILLACYFAACNLHPAVSAQHLRMALLVDFLPFWALVAMQICLLGGLRTGSFAAFAPGPRDRDGRA